MPYVRPFRFILYLFWCPGYVDIEGNEEADAAAKHAVDSPQVDAIAIQSDDAKVAATTHHY